MRRSVIASVLRLWALPADLIQIVIHWLRAFLSRRHRLVAEVLALRSQLALYKLQEQKGTIPKPRCTRVFRLTWVVLSRTFCGWKDALCVVRPETVIRWHKKGFRLYWRYKSHRKAGRQQVTSFGNQPRYIIRDNDSVYGSAVPELTLLLRA